MFIHYIEGFFLNITFLKLSDAYILVVMLY